MSKKSTTQLEKKANPTEARKPWCYIPVYDGHRAKIDEEDYEKVMKHKWRVLIKPSGRLRVVTTVATDKGPRQVALGQLLMNPPKDKMVYARRFMDGLDFRKRNLILCTMKERQRILPKSLNFGSSRFKGVHFVKKTQKWRAQIAVERKNISLGIYEKEIDAAMAYNKAALTYFGEMAYQNILDQSVHPKRRD